jgi:Uncharacterized protein involved in exopolysaccharide biosynthesis
MHSTETQFDIRPAFRTGWKWRKYILFFALLITIITAIYFYFQKNIYKAYGSFFPASAVISGRINLFREVDPEWIDMFGGENELDRVYVIANSANVVSYLIGKFKMAEHYHIDTNAPKASEKIYKRFAKNYSVSRSGYKHIEINFTDEDSELAYQVVNEAMNRIDYVMKDLYRTINQKLNDALMNRIDSLDSEIALFTDSLAQLRVQYGIYDLISPSRNMHSNFIPRGSGINYALGMEIVQNVEEIKDRLVTDRAKYHSLAHQFKTATYDGYPMIHVTQWATPNGPKAGPYRTIAVLIAFFSSLVIGWLIALVSEQLKTVSLE